MNYIMNKDTVSQKKQEEMHNLLSISPISQTYLLSRPELLGILFILLAIYLLLKNNLFLVIYLLKNF